MSRNSTKPTVTISEFPGLVTVDSPEEVGHTGLVKALNVDITRQKKIKRRKGATQLAAASIDAACGGEDYLIYTSTNDLVALDETFLSPTTLRSDMTKSQNLCALAIGGRVIYSNGYETGFIQDNTHHGLGIASPAPPVLTTTVVGDMVAGRYQLLYTYVRKDGFESGAGIAAIIDLDQENKGIRVSHIANADPDIVAINIYCSLPDGHELYFAVSVANTTTTTVYNGNSRFLRHGLRTQFKVPPPAFDIVEEHNNRILYGKDNIIYLSDPYAPEHVQDGEAYFPFNDRVTLIASVEGGVFVGTEKATYFINGDTLEKMNLDTIAPYGAVMGTRTYIDGALLGDGSVSAILPAWMSHKGLCVGMPDGSLQNVTQTSVVIPKGLRGTTMFRQEDGQNHIISVIQK